MNMSLNEFDVIVAKGVAITLLTKYFWFGGWRYTLFILTNQNHCDMPKLNDS